MRIEATIIRKRGRPRKPAGERIETSACVHLLPGELSAIIMAACGERMSISAWIRRLVLRELGLEPARRGKPAAEPSGGSGGSSSGPGGAGPATSATTGTRRRASRRRVSAATSRR